MNTILKNDLEKQPSGLACWHNQKEYTGVSTTQYQLQQKLLKAKELLISSNLNISEIAYSLKFENAGQFSTFFKKKEGMTPSEFRERSH